MNFLSKVDVRFNKFVRRFENQLSKKVRRRTVGILARTSLRLQALSPNSALRQYKLWNRGHGLAADTSGGLINIFASGEDFNEDWVIKRRYRNAKGTVWLRQTSRHKYTDRKLQLEQFARLILPTLKEPITLITSDGDTNVPEDVDPTLFKTLIDHPKIKTWYTQNLNTSSISDKLRPIPIGLDLHLNRGFGVGSEVVDLLIKTRLGADAGQIRRDDKVLVDCHLGPTHPDRSDLSRLLSANSLFEFVPERVDQKTLWEKYARYKYVLCVRGNGRDCYRTWEALMLGAIPIIVGEDIFGITKGLPVIEVNALVDLVALDAAQLAKSNVKNDIDPLEFLSRDWF